MLKKKPMDQIISNLPEFRVNPCTPVFNTTAVDLCGPYLIKQGRARVKRWVTLFTCAATRASDIQVVYSLETDSFLKALSRFMCNRQCKPALMLSDCGTNFVGADNDIKRFLLTEENQKKIEDGLLRKGVKWQFNPPKSSHRAGIVERLFRIFRKCMMSLNTSCSMNDEEFLTATTMINSILNQRPMARLSDDPDDLRTICPAQLMSGATDENANPSQLLTGDGYRRSYRALQEAVDNWWSRWQRQYLSTLQERQKWFSPARNLKVGDLVLMTDANVGRNQWRKALVTQTYPDKWGVVRKVTVITARMNKAVIQKSSFTRDVRKLVLLEEATN